MQTINVYFGNIVSIGYDEQRQVLRVKLEKSTYEYNRVLKYVFRDFLSSQDKTKFYNSKIRWFYSVHKVNKLKNK